jgi:RimJ/RimL family protein N-acetyltransferase
MSCLRAGPPAPHPLADAVALEAMALRLEARGWAAAPLARLLPVLVRGADALAPSARARWLAGLGQAWRRHGDALGLDARRHLLALASAWAAWPLAIAVGGALRDAGALGAGGAHLLAVAHGQMGESGTALELAEAALADDPRDEAALRLRENLLAWQQWREAHGPMPGVGLGDPLLRLEPLGHQHAADFAWQYYDPSIGERCCLPSFGDDDDGAAWHAWLDGLYASGDEWPYAVLHREWGFIGCVHLIRHGGTGFLYYWIGRDWRGGKHGARAAGLLLRGAARHAGLDSCYAKVFRDNAASRRTLVRLGFGDLGVAGAAPHGEELFYRLGPAMPRAAVLRELDGLIEAIGCEVRPDPRS